jgi:hypothetical protein
MALKCPVTFEEHWASLFSRPTSEDKLLKGHLARFIEQFDDTPENLPKKKMNSTTDVWLGV